MAGRVLPVVKRMAAFSSFAVRAAGNGFQGVCRISCRVTPLQNHFLPTVTAILTVLKQGFSPEVREKRKDLAVMAGLAAQLLAFVAVAAKRQDRAEIVEREEEIAPGVFVWQMAFENSVPGPVPGCVRA